MSGGSYDYICDKLRYECAGRMEDDVMNEMIEDLCNVLHDLEWWQSCDSNEETYRCTLQNFKGKWLKKEAEDLELILNEAPTVEECNVDEQFDYDGAKYYLNEIVTPLLASMHYELLKNEYRELLTDLKTMIEESEKEAQPLDLRIFYFISGSLEECAKIDAMIAERLQ